ncbi:MAG: hypothetical protein Q8R28_14230 [Dehalococcoidia bacterium]|nr:hypothetical protein [Dehalococcoidia bacterium]
MTVHLHNDQGECVGSICGPTRGHYGRPWRIDGPRGIKRWLDGNEQPLRAPRIVYCEHPQHRWWATARPNRTRFLRAAGYVQRWVLSKREIRRAVKAWDIFSLDMPSRLVCPTCAGRERAARGEG